MERIFRADVPAPSTLMRLLRQRHRMRLVHPMNLLCLLRPMNLLRLVHLMWQRRPR